mmetsp:Transcript_58999/g.97541  ORF Transcript_58999/g.97541 Transcript_58999/m.97541 type:complete len:287 (+) Transcript_58999:60-920(+)|eukprot:CAMPEP_0119308450 /NCGR_PEP_ID=MMETSP1333-20130426/10913_1 /TAXON_ID=418940 /ORGANISM="Scyphosphaera apsteinii, Strain RCC1455" /LENGTH=286 /DNA_ID=CAMNT_0007312213 /DNA_START=69 /DNA_END=929 /DNA_ORIENTATION=+
MGKTATPFKDIGKACTDLLSKDYKVGKNTVEIKSKAANGVTFTPLATKSGDSISGSLAMKYGFPGGITTEATMNSSGVLSATTEVAGLAKGLTVSLDCETTTKGNALFSSGKATVDYKQDVFTAKAVYDYYKGAASAAASAAYAALTVGASADYNVSKSALTKYAAAGQYAASDFTIAAKLSEALGKPDGKVFEGSYFHTVSKAMQVGTEIKKPASSEVSLGFGCAYQLDKSTAVKGKVDTDGILSGSYKQKLSSISTLTLAAAVDTVNLTESSKHKFGLALNITP